MRAGPSGWREYLCKSLRNLAAEGVLLGCVGEPVGVDVVAEGGEPGVDGDGGFSLSDDWASGGRGGFSGHLRDFVDAVDERGEALALVLARRRWQVAVRIACMGLRVGLQLLGHAQLHH